MPNPDRAYNTASAAIIADVANGALITGKTDIIMIITKVIFSTDSVGKLALCSPAGTLIDN